MRKILFPRISNSKIRAVMWLALFFMSSVSLQAQTSFFCSGNVNVSIEANCSVVIGPEGFGAPTGSTVTLKVNDADRADRTLSVADLGQNIEYTLTVPGAQPCWGNINLEHKLLPVITCPAAVEIACSQSTEILETATATNPLLNATATDCYGALKVSSFDNVVNLTCAADPVFSQVITRTFVTVGQNGMRSSCTQEIKVRRALLAGVTMPVAYSASCSTNSVTDLSVTGYPTYDPDGTGSIPAINLIPGETGGGCMLISDYEDLELPKCGPDQLIKRTWRVINMCQAGTANEMIMAEQLITITTPLPTIDPIAAITISTDGGVATSHGACSSTATLPTATVSGLCTGQVVSPEKIVISIPGLAQTTNGGAIPAPGLPLGGPYTITYTATDDCGYSNTLDVQVTVVDNVAPQCNTQDANITLGADGTAIAGYQSFDRNSSDNCSSTVWVSVRRLNGLCTTGSVDDFGPTVSFCCDDVPTGMEADVMVEQLVTDKDPTLPTNYSDGVQSFSTDGSGAPGETFTGNVYRCMATATVKLNAIPQIICAADVSVTCAEYNSSTAFGTTTTSSTCSSSGFTMDFSDSGTLVCNGGGTITRTHRLLSGTDVVATCAQTITVTGNLTITAPADFTDLDCGSYTCTNLPLESITGSPVVTGASCSASIIVFTATESNCTLTNGTLSFTRTWTVDPASDPEGCFTGQTFSHVVTTLTNCCVNPIRGQTTFSTEGTLILQDAPVVASDYSFRWFLRADDTSLNGVAGITIEAPDSIKATGLTENTNYYVVIRQNNNSTCLDTARIDTQTGSSLIFGSVSSEFGEPIENVRVSLEGNQAAGVIGDKETMSEVMTDEDGVYEFEEVNLPSLNKLTLVKDGDDRDNVTTRDLLIMSRHILGLKEISSPYSYIAADLTGNGKISTADMLLMQKIVLGITYDLPNNSSWRFVDADHVFDDMNTILDYEFPEYFSFTGEETEEHLSDLNFIAVKIGDLAGAYGADLKGGNSTTKALSLETDNQQLLPGAIIEVPIRAGDAKNISGYQHAYQFDTDKIVFTGIDFGSALEIADNNFGYQHLGKGFLTTSWFDTEEKNIEAGSVIYTLRFEVKEAAQLSDVLSISSEYTQAEAYFDADKVGTVQFSFTESIGDKLIVTNAPNPFKESTQVRFQAPSKGEAVIRVSDISGKEVYRSKLTAAKGENQLVINKSDLKQVGIYILKIDLNGSSATQKIVVID